MVLRETFPKGGGFLNEILVVSRLRPGDGCLKTSAITDTEGASE
jgi:hypothetical protein